MKDKAGFAKGLARKILRPRANWFQNGGPHGITLGVDVARALGLDPQRNDKGYVRISVGNESLTPGRINARNSGRLSQVDELFQKLGISQDAVSPISVRIANDNNGMKLLFDVIAIEAERSENGPPIAVLGCPYTNVGTVSRSVQRDPFEIDPDKVDRANQGHATTQDALADFLRSRAIEPRSPTADEPDFDLAWSYNDSIRVAEVKSITSNNEEKQLRLALGQVLRYRHALATDGKHVVAVVVAEREPSDASWIGMCKDLGVVLVWPDVFERVVPQTVEAHQPA